MAKSIRSKAKRKLRAAKREKIAAKERLKLLAIQEAEGGVKMVQDPVENNKVNDMNIPAFSGDVEETMDVQSDNQAINKTKRKKPKKTKSSSGGKNIKRLKKKGKKYKW